MSSEHATFTILEEPPEDVHCDEFREQIAKAHEPFKLYRVKPFDHDGPFPGRLEVLWFPAHKHIELCWDADADVPRLKHVHKWWGGGAEEADARCLTDGIEEFLNEHDRFAAEAHFKHHEGRHLPRAA